MMAIKKPFIVSFYSYKGGTGRTTAAANVAAILAKGGKKVVCIDMDMEGPGLNVVFNVPEDSITENLQSYFIENSSFKEKLLLNLRETLKRSEDWSNNLYLIPASSSFTKIIDYSDGNRMVKLINRLKLSINKLCSPDFLILDSPNGYGDLAALSMYASNFIVILFRYSKQHLLGTIRICEFTKRYNTPFLAVASCVPPITPDKKNLKQKWVDIIKSTLEIDRDPVEITDDDEMKWLERVVLFDDNPKEFKAYKGYSKIAEVLLNNIKISPEGK